MSIDISSSQIKINLNHVKLLGSINNPTKELILDASNILFIYHNHRGEEEEEEEITDYELRRMSAISINGVVFERKGELPAMDWDKEANTL